MSTAQVTFSQAPTGAEAPAADPTVKINEQASNTATPQPQGDRPAWLPEQFKTAEDFAKSWTDQRAEITKLQQAQAAAKKVDPAASAATEDKTAPALKIEDKPAAGEQTEAEKAAAQAVAQAGLDVSKWQEEFNTSRTVSEEGRAEIAKGLEGLFGDKARAIVDDFVEGQRMRVENVEGQIFTVAGGKEEYAKMVGWAAQNMSASEQSAYNAAMDSGDVNAMSLAVDGLKARYVRAEGSSPSLISGDGSIGSGDAAFASTHEMTTAMKDPRYRADPVYRKSVEQRAMRSNF
jgi:excinuclease UvrABC nuclease subunit